MYVIINAFIVAFIGFSAELPLHLNVIYNYKWYIYTTSNGLPKAVMTLDFVFPAKNEERIKKTSNLNINFFSQKCTRGINEIYD